MTRKRHLFQLIFLTLFNLCLLGCGQEKSYIPGYVEARYTYIAPNFSGVLQKLSVKRGEFITAGHPLFTLELEPESDQLENAKSNFQAAIAERLSDLANLDYAKLDYHRQFELLQTRAVQQATVDLAKANLDKAKAQLNHAEANVNGMKALLANAFWSQMKKIVTASKEALVFDTYFQTGELVPANQAVLSLLAPEDIKIIFFVSEPQLGSIQLGQKITVRCDGCSQPVTANIDFISPQAEYTPPVIYSGEARTKLVYRIEAALQRETAKKMHPGQPVQIYL